MAYYDQRTALLFPNVNLGTNWIVNKAYITFTYDVYGNDLDVWISGCVGVSALPDTVVGMAELDRTNSRAHWEETINPGAQGNPFNSCDISCVIQELVDAGGGTNVVLFVEGMTMELNEWSSTADIVWCTEPATLHVYYSYKFDEIPSSGVLINSEVSNYLTYHEFGSSGIRLGGIATRITDETASGGILVNGVVQEILSATMPTSGGILVNGEANSSITYIPSGGIQVGGQCGFDILLGVFIEGGIKVGGTTVHAMILNGDTSGGIVINGSPLYHVVYPEVASDGVLLSGVAVVLHVFPFTGSGTLQLGGAGTWIPIYTTESVDSQFHNGYLYRVLVTIPAFADLTTFPVVIVTTLDTSKADGTFQFESSSQTVLTSEVESWDQDTGDLVAWVHTDVSSSTTTDIYLYYGVNQ